MTTLVVDCSPVCGKPSLLVLLPVGLPDDIAQVSLLAGYSLLKDYRGMKTLKERRLKLMKTLSVSYDVLEEVEEISIKEVAKYCLSLGLNRLNFDSFMRNSKGYLLLFSLLPIKLILN